MGLGQNGSTWNHGTMGSLALSALAAPCAASGMLAPTVASAARQAPASRLRVIVFMNSSPSIFFGDFLLKCSAVIGTIAPIFVEGADLGIHLRLGALFGALADQDAMVLDHQFRLG